MKRRETPAKNKNFLPLSRRVFLHPFWKEKRVFSRAEAWIDLIRTANWQAGEVLVRGKLIPPNRGELVASLRFLAERWQWSPMKVSRFIRRLETETMTQGVTRHGESILTVTNYAAYNRASGNNETPLVPETRQQRDGDETVTRQRRDRGETEARQNKEGEDRKDRKEIKKAAASPSPKSARAREKFRTTADEPPSEEEVLTFGATADIPPRCGGNVFPVAHRPVPSLVNPSP